MSGAIPDRSELLRAQVPSELGQKIRTAGQALAGERRHVTVLFADIAGFTSMAEQLDPEEVTELVNRCLTSLSESIYAYEGTVDKFIGDAVMAIFGAPLAHEDDPERALRAALDMRARLEQINRELQAEGRKPLGLHIGINSGMVVAGGVGSDLRMEYTVMGDTVNLASRLEGVATSGQILVSESTQRLARHAFEFGKPSHLQVKGKHRPVVAYELLKPLPQAEMLRRTELGYRPLVGREREVQSLAELLELAAKRQGQVAAVVGEAGVGKSRLVFELVKQARERGFLVAEGDCESFDITQAYQVFKPLLRGILGLDPDWGAEETKRELRAALEALNPSLGEQTPFLGALLDLPDERLSQMLDTERQPRIKAALKILLHQLSQTRNILLVFDDLQWADELSRELLDYLVENLPTLPVLLCAVYRPGFGHPWAGKTYYSQITLKPLASEQEKQLVQNLLPGAPPELVEAVASHAEGNPFYIEEIVKSGLETGAIRREGQTYSLSKEVELPGSIHGLIMARIDRLEEKAKSLLQAAAVIGREFPISILAQVAEKLDQLDERLTELETMELVYEKQILPELEYLFKHYLTQEVAYQSILVKKRKELHRQVAKAIEEVYGDKLEQHYERLAYHYERAEDFKRAADYFQKAAGKVRDIYSDAASEKLVAKTEESLTKLHESRHAGARLIAPLLTALMFLAALAGYLWGLADKGISLSLGGVWTRILQRPAPVFFLIVTLGLFALACLLINRSVRKIQFLITSSGVRVVWGKENLDIGFGNFQAVRRGRWWQSFQPHRQGGFPFWGPAVVGSQLATHDGVFLYLNRRLPFSAKWGTHGRLLYLEVENPEWFLKEINRAWNRWRLTHTAAQTEAKADSSAAGSASTSSNSRAA